MNWFSWKLLRGWRMTWREKSLAADVLSAWSFCTGTQCWQMFCLFDIFQCILGISMCYCSLPYVCMCGWSLSIALLPVLARTLLIEKFLILMHFSYLFKEIIIDQCASLPVLHLIQCCSQSIYKRKWTNSGIGLHSIMRLNCNCKL